MKRFTETTKWQDPWYRQLDPTQKCLWQYLCDACDSAGVIDPDWDLISFQIGGEVNEDSLPIFAKRVIKMDNGKLFIVGFLKFQYGSLSHECKAHKAIFLLCDRYGIDPETLEPHRVSNGYPMGIHTHKEKDKEKDKEKTVENEEEQKNLNRARSLFNMRLTTPLDKAQVKAWNDARHIIKETTEEEWIALESVYSSTDPDTVKYRKQGLSTLFNNWTDSITKAVAKSPQQEDASWTFIN